MRPDIGFPAFPPRHLYLNLKKLMWGFPFSLISTLADQRTDLVYVLILILKELRWSCQTSCWHTNCASSLLRGPTYDLYLKKSSGGAKNFKHKSAVRGGWLSLAILVDQTTDLVPVLILEAIRQGLLIIWRIPAILTYPLKKLSV